MSGRARRMGAVMRKEWGQIRRDPSTFGIAGLLPLLLLFLFGYAVSLDTAATKTALVLQDNGGAAQRLAGAFAASPSFRIVPVTSVDAARADLVAGKLRAIIVIPQDFSRATARGAAATVQLITDGSVPNTAAFADGHTRALVRTWAAEEARARGQAREPSGVQALRIVPHYVYNATLKSRYFLVPGAIAIVMAMIGSMLTALVVAREWERATMEALLATKLSVTEMIIAKVTPYFLLGLGSMSLCVVVAVAWYELPLRGSWFALIGLSAAFLFATLGQGLLISAAAKSQFVSTQYALLSGFLPSLLLSGFLFEISSMPVAIQWLTWLVPARYLIPPLESLFLAGDIWGLIGPSMGALTAFGLFFFWRAIKSTQRSIS
jgi:ABC-2 type transport system permease protein